MPIEQTESGVVITGEEIKLAQLIALKGAVNLEANGLRRSGRSANTMACQLLGLRKGTACAITVKKLQERIDAWPKTS